MRPLPPVAEFLDNGSPANADPHTQKAWLRALEQLLATQTAAHGGPIAYVEGHVLAIDAVAPPAPVTTISAVDPGALGKSRDAFAAVTSSAVLWTHVEDALYPAGWAADPTTLLRPGAVGLSGDERPTAVPPCAAMPRCCGNGRPCARLSMRPCCRSPRPANFPKA